MQTESSLKPLTLFLSCFYTLDSSKIKKIFRPFSAGFEGQWEVLTTTEQLSSLVVEQKMKNMIPACEGESHLGLHWNDTHKYDLAP